MNLKEHIEQHKNEFDSEKMSATSEVLFKKRLQGELHQPKKSKIQMNSQKYQKCWLF